MRRIGIAASKMARGNLPKYNVFVIVIAFLCSLLLFFICGFAILAALFLVSLVCRPFLPPEFNAAAPAIVRVCLVALAVVIGILNVLAVIKNVKVNT